MRVAKELSAGFGGSTELDDWETLVHKIHEIKEARADIRQINVFARNPENGWSVAASDEDPPTRTAQQSGVDQPDAGPHLR